MKVLASFLFAGSLALILILYKKRKIVYSKRWSEPSDKVIDANQLSKLKQVRRWLHVGRVQNLFIYPLMYGKGICVPKYDFKLNEICTTYTNRRYRDNMFVVYEEETKRIHPHTFILSGIKVNIVNKYLIRFEANYMPTLTLKNIGKEIREIIMCPILYADKVYATVKCVDCGTEAARWISIYLNGTKYGLRLGYLVETPTKVKTLWDTFPFSKLYIARQEKIDINLNPFLDPTYYRIVSSQSLVEISEVMQMKMTSMWNQIRPTIIISSFPFTENQWGWIKIGKAIFKSVRPWPSIIRKASDLAQVPMGLRLKLATMAYELYVPGLITVGDEVYVNVSNEN